MSWNKSSDLMHVVMSCPSYTMCSESHCALRLRYVNLVVSVEVAVEVCCCCVTFHCIQLSNRLKCNTGKAFNCLIQFLLTVVLSIEERVFLVHKCTVTF